PMSSGMGMPWSSGFSPWNMGGSPWSSGFSPWSMGSSPWSSGFSPWSMGGNNSPWGGNGWNSSMWPWGSGGGNSWGGNSWMPWSNNSNFLGRRNNNDWVTSMFLMNSLNNQQPWNMGMMPNYPYQAPIWNQGMPAAQQLPQALAYPPVPAQLPNLVYPTQPPGPILDSGTTTESSNFPAASSSFSPFLESAQPITKPDTLPTQPGAAPEPTTHPNPATKTLVFPDGSRF
ncbi:MAG TPA: hypothetical protein PLM98_01805, partial [Thiolinea sp.]|nr:hypothetical protein [Thiolinea sp.]